MKNIKVKKMEKEEVIIAKREIATMLGWKNVGMKDMPLYAKSENHSGYTDDDLKFDSDWNWIMDAVRFIENKKYGVEIIGNYCKIIGTYIMCSQKNKEIAVFKALSEFAKLHNNNKIIYN